MQHRLLALRRRALGLAAPKRLQQIKNVPTMGELGLKGFEAGSWYGVLAPAATPRDIVAKLHADIVKVLARQVKLFPWRLVVRLLSGRICVRIGSAYMISPSPASQG